MAKNVRKIQIPLWLLTLIQPESPACEPWRQSGDIQARVNLPLPGWIRVKLPLRLEGQSGPQGSIFWLYTANLSSISKMQLKSVIFDKENCHFNKFFTAKKASDGCNRCLQFFVTRKAGIQWKIDTTKYSNFSSKNIYRGCSSAL